MRLTGVRGSRQVHISNQAQITVEPAIEGVSPQYPEYELESAFAIVGRSHQGKMGARAMHATSALGGPMCHSLRVCHATVSRQPIGGSLRNQSGFFESAPGRFCVGRVESATGRDTVDFDSASDCIGNNIKFQNNKRDQNKLQPKTNHDKHTTTNKTPSHHGSRAKNGHA